MDKDFIGYELNIHIDYVDNYEVLNSHVIYRTVEEAMGECLESLKTYLRNSDWTDDATKEVIERFKEDAIVELNEFCESDYSVFSVSSLYYGQLID